MSTTENAITSESFEVSTESLSNFTEDGYSTEAPYQPIFGLWNPSLDIPTICILGFCMVAGNSNILTFIVYGANGELKEKPMNYLVVAMAAVDLLLCNVGAALDIAQVATSLTGFARVWCAAKLCLLGFCHYTSLFLMAFLALYRMYLVLRRYNQGAISTNAAWTAIVISLIVGGLRLVGRIRGLKNNVNFLRCMGYVVGLPDVLDVKDFLFVLAMVCGFAAYAIQILAFLLNVPSGSTSNVVGVGQGTSTGVDLNSISTGPAGMVILVSTLIVYLIPGLPYTIGYRPYILDTLNQHALMRSVLYIHAAIKPLVYLALVPVYRLSLRMLGGSEPYGPSNPDNIGMERQNGQSIESQ